MKNVLLTFSFMLSMMVGLTACSRENSIVNTITTDQNMLEDTTDDTATNHKVRVKIGDKTFVATLSDTPVAKAFKALLPLTINMKELNTNEKYADLPKSLPINATVPASIRSGDLMLYGSSTLVLFYKSFSTSYSYTKIGKIEDVTGLVAALGMGDVTVTFEMEE